MFPLPQVRLLGGEELLSDHESDPRAQAVNRGGAPSNDQVGAPRGAAGRTPTPQTLCLLTLSLFQEERTMSQQTPGAALLRAALGGMTHSRTCLQTFPWDAGSPTAPTDPLGNRVGTRPAAHHGKFISPAI